MKGKELKEKRLANGISLYKLGSILNIHRSTVLQHEKLPRLNDKQIEMYNAVLKDFPSVRKTLSHKEQVLLRYPKAELRTPLYNEGLVHYVFTTPSKQGKPLTNIPLSQMNDLIRPITKNEAWAEAAKLLPSLIIDSSYALRLKNLENNPNLHNTKVRVSHFPISTDDSLNNAYHTLRTRTNNRINFKENNSIVQKTNNQKSPIETIDNSNVSLERTKMELSPSRDIVLQKYPEALIGTDDFKNFYILSGPNKSAKRLATNSRLYSPCDQQAWKDAADSLKIKIDPLGKNIKRTKNKRQRKI